MSDEKNIADGSGNERPAHLEEVQDDEIPDTESSLTEEKPQTTNEKPEPANMEVHHHPQLNHKAKPWREYLLEGLMIFLAVTLGFFAENLREHISESNHENEFAKELYTELKDDSVAASTKIYLRRQKEKDMDYLSSFFRDSALTNLPKELYPAFTTSLYIINSYAFEPRDGILSQLRNSGSLRYFKSVKLQKLLGDISVNINNVRYRNEQEYQYFASPIKPFMLKYFDWRWLDNLRKEDTTTSVLDVINHYRGSTRNHQQEMLNIASFDRKEASNLVLFYKQMLVSTRSLQLNSYIITNHQILQVLRENYSLENQ